MVEFFFIFNTEYKKTTNEDISPKNKDRKPTLDNIIFAPDFLLLLEAYNSRHALLKFYQQ